MSSSLYVTFDHVFKDSGAGKVCLNEIQALSEITELRDVVAKSYDGENPSKFVFHRVDVDSVYGYNPFIYDYIVSDILNVNPDLAHFSCSPASKIMDKVNPKKSVCNIVAHHLKTSIEEHERIFQQPYPFIHNTDPYLHDLLIKHSKRVDCVFTPSNHSAEWIKENLQPKQVKVIPHGVDLPFETSQYPEQFTVGYMGAFGPDKGLLYLLLAWEKLMWSDAKLVFAGSCCKHLEPWIREFAPNSNIELMGWMEDTKQFFDAVSCVCVPSVTEGFGLLTLEAMGHGKPAVVSTGAGSEMVVDNHITGIKTVPRNVGSIIEGLINMRNCNFMKMGRLARKKAEHYTWDIIREWYKGAYKEITE